MTNFRLSALTSRIRYAATRLRLGLLLATGCLTRDAARDIVTICEPIAGWYPILSLTSEYALAHALDLYEDHPAMPRLIEQACKVVARKWEDDRGDLHAASGWALDLAIDFADEEGIELIDLPKPAA